MQIVSHTSCNSYTNRYHTYTWFIIMFWKLHMTWFSLAIPLQSGELYLYQALFMLCYAIFSTNMERIWTQYGTNPAIKICEWMCWSSSLVSLNGVCLWSAQSNKKISSRVCLHIAMARSRPSIKVKRDESKNSCQHLPNEQLDFPYVSKDIFKLRYCSKGDPSYLLNYHVNNQ